MSICFEINKKLRQSFRLSLWYGVIRKVCKRMQLKAYLFWSLLSFTCEYSQSEVHSRVIMVLKTTMRHWGIVLPNRTINDNFLNIHVLGSLHKYRLIKPPCITYTQQTSSRHRTCMSTRGNVRICVPWCVDGT